MKDGGPLPDDDGALVVDGDALEELDELDVARGFALSLHPATTSAATTTKTAPRQCIRAMVEVVVRRDVIT
ncbi:MAG TPA: hypothetical protein VFV00_00015 [Acidimicrobiales bacterium]|nr:hypothetical protein [Acidimicrobiales bacterium]